MKMPGRQFQSGRYPSMYEGKWWRQDLLVAGSVMFDDVLRKRTAIID